MSKKTQGSKHDG